MKTEPAQHSLPSPNYSSLFAKSLAETLRFPAVISSIIQFVLQTSPFNVEFAVKDPTKETISSHPFKFSSPNLVARAELQCSSGL